MSAIAHLKPAVYPAISAGRFATLIRTEVPARLPSGFFVALIGLPDDTGVKLNNGRPGAKEGPAAFRAAIARYGAAAPMNPNRPTMSPRQAGAFESPPALQFPAVIDFGDIEPSSQSGEAGLDETHDRVTAAVTQILHWGGERCIPVAIGGGHDLTFPFVRAVARHRELDGGVYYDAHLDVRAEKGSGMPFRAIVEQVGVSSLVCIGVEPLVNAAEHDAWFTSNGGMPIDVHGFHQIRAQKKFMPPFPTPGFLSLDMDVFPASSAPGVSALNPIGLPPALVALSIEEHGVDPNVCCFDIMELNPAFDQDGRTARLAAHMFLCFLRGLASRPTDLPDRS